MPRKEDDAISIRRVSAVHSKEPFVLSKCAVSREYVTVGNSRIEVGYCIGLVPLDCVDDITKASSYNPRHPREVHRDELMDQIGTYGLIQPLVGTLEKVPLGDPNGARLFLIDGRHRYHGLLELDPDLRDDVKAQARARELRKDVGSLSDISKLRPPRRRSVEIILSYEPMREDLGRGKQGAPMVPVKVYTGQEEVERIGMAVFLNRGQKRLAGGEAIDKIYLALLQALDDEKSTSDNPSERGPVGRVAKGQGADAELVVLSQHVARIMNDDESPWYDLIGRYQGEVTDVEKETRKKPLTAKNFMNFVQQITDDQPLDQLNEKQRDLEVGNLNKLGNVFATKFGWPEDIPTLGSQHTATSILCRSFLLLTVGIVLNERYAPASKKLMSVELSGTVWVGITGGVEALQTSLQEQAEIRRGFERKKIELRAHPSAGPDRERLLLEVDKLRGKLWSLDTIIPSLRSRLGSIIR